jgi:Fe-S-cluster-containing dehydrogenase component
MKALLIDYEFCYGCHTCEAACKFEHGWDKGQGLSGIELHRMGPREIADDKWEYTFVPVPTELCDLCEERVAQGKLPTCVHHCTAKVMEYGEADELMERFASKPKMAMYTIK